MSNISGLFTPSQDSANDITRGATKEVHCMRVNLSAFKFHDESKDVIDAQLTNLFNNSIRIVLIPALFFIGFPSNLVNMMVFFKHGLKQRINLCLFCLALVDIIFVTLAFLMYIEKAGYKFSAPSRKVGHLKRILINNRVFGFYSGSILSSQFVSAVIAGERCLCVVWPLRFNDLLKTRTVGLVLLVGILVIFAGRFVVAMKFYAVCVLDIVTGLESYQLISSDFYNAHRKLVNTLDGVVLSFGLPVLSCVFVTITTIITAAKLQKSTEFQRESSSSAAAASTASSVRNVTVTKMLIYLSLQFIILNIPNMVFRASLVFLPQLSASGNWANLFFFLTVIPEVCGVLSSSINFLVYYFCGTKYRETVHGVFCRSTKALPQK